jgi:AcrR family transcriptional regulator
MPASTTASAQDAAIDALLALLAERRWDEIGLPDIAERAGVTLGALRGAFPSKGAILAGFARRIDQAVLAGGTAAEPGFAEPVRERLFEVVMRRFDALEPYKAAIRGARSALMHDPLALAAWNRVELTSAQWMLAAAGIDAEGPAGALKAQALVLMVAAVVPVWLDDDEAGSPKTMKALDTQLHRADRLARLGDGVEHLLRPFADLAARRRSRRGEARDEADERVETTEEFMRPV